MSLVKDSFLANGTCINVGRTWLGQSETAEEPLLEENILIVITRPTDHTIATSHHPHPAALTLIWS